MSKITIGITVYGCINLYIFFLYTFMKFTDARSQLLEWPLFSNCAVMPHFNSEIFLRLKTSMLILLSEISIYGKASLKM